MPIALGVLFIGAAALALAAIAEKAAGATAATTSATSSTAPAVTSSTATGQVTSADLQSIGAKYGWSGAQLADWMSVIQQESGGNPQVVNKSSGAAGIAQFINGFSEYAKYGGNANTVTGQLTAMANYIKQRYGDPSTAWAHEQANNWY